MRKNIAQWFSVNEWVVDKFFEQVATIMLGMMVTLLINLQILLRTVSASRLRIRSWGMELLWLETAAVCWLGQDHSLILVSLNAQLFYPFEDMLT